MQTCPFSGEIFKPRRKNQVFANPRYRMEYHNTIAAELRRVKSPVDKALEKNFIILSELLKKGETKSFKKEELLMKGFNTSVFTHFETYDGKPTLGLYHFLFPKPIDQNSIIVVNIQKND